MGAEADALALRPIASADTGRIHQWASEPAACRYQPWGPNSWQETEAFVTAAIEAWATRPQQRWVYSVVEPSGLVVGVGEVKVRGPGRAEISYAVHTDYWGRGYGSAIARLLTHWSFDDLGVERVEATCDPRNGASETVLRRAGMTYEGTLRHVVRLRDGWRDSKVFSVLRDEWPTP